MTVVEDLQIEIMKVLLIDTDIDHPVSNNKHNLYTHVKTAVVLMAICHCSFL